MSWRENIDLFHTQSSLAILFVFIIINLVGDKATSGRLGNCLILLAPNRVSYMSEQTQRDKGPWDGPQASNLTEDNYRMLFDTLEVGFVVADLLYDEASNPVDLLVLESNPSFERLMQMETSSVGKHALEIFPSAEASWFEAYGNVVATGENLHLENYLAELDSWFDLYIWRLGEDGSTRFAIVFNDITERKRVEGQQAFLLRLSDRLRALHDPVVVEAVQDAVTQEALAHFEADRCYYSEIEDDSAVIRSDAYRDGLLPVAVIH